MILYTRMRPEACAKVEYKQPAKERYKMTKSKKEIRVTRCYGGSGLKWEHMEVVDVKPTKARPAFSGHGSRRNGRWIQSRIDGFFRQLDYSMAHRREVNHG